MTHRLFVGQGLDVGLKRKQNEDAVSYHYPDNFEDYQNYGALFIVADGVGGLSDGVLASEMAVKGLIERYYYYAKISDKPVEHNLRQALIQVNTQVHNAYENSATTVVAAVIKGSKLTLAHVGDSRGYLYHNQNLRQITADHVHPVELEDGRTKYKLVQALGYKSDVDPDIARFDLEQNDSLLIMSDGATRYLNLERLQELRRQVQSPQTLADTIVDESNRSGGVDNISVIIVDIDAPLNNQNDLKKHFLSMKKQETISSQKPPSPVSIGSIDQDKSQSWLIPALLIVLALILLSGGYYLWTNQATGTSNPDTPIATASTTQETIIIIATAENNDTNSPTPELTLIEGVIIEFDDSSATYVRIEEDVIAFVIEINQAYQIDDIFETSNDITWYRLYDERNEIYGWIAESNLPDYRFMP